MINYNTLINYEKTNLPVDRHVSIMVTLQNGEKSKSSKKLTENCKADVGHSLKTVMKLNCTLLKESKRTNIGGKCNETDSIHTDNIPKCVRNNLLREMSL